MILLISVSFPVSPSFAELLDPEMTAFSESVVSFFWMDPLLLTD